MPMANYIVIARIVLILSLAIFCGWMLSQYVQEMFDDQTEYQEGVKALIEECASYCDTPKVDIPAKCFYATSGSFIPAAQNRCL